MPAIDYEADTEFNDALRRHGILPPKQPDAQVQQDQQNVPNRLRSPSPTLSDLDDLDDLDIKVDDQVRRQQLEQHVEQRKLEQQQLQQKQMFGRVYPISKPDYKREVTEASEQELPGEPQGWGTGVVCVLFKDSVPASKQLMPIIDELASLYPATKFVSIVSDQCIENYPDKNVPTIIVYRNGKMMGQVVGISAYGGDKMTLIDVERFLFAFRGIDFHLKQGYDKRSFDQRQSEILNNASTTNGDLLKPLSKSSNKQNRKQDEDDEDDDDEQDSENDQTFVGGGRRSGIRQSQRKLDSDDEEFDL
ncbi:Proteolipid protein 2 [Microbotryomycetes sp. JL221]|nr:Proteolipid protein 2 [Microbotryomycetes sp. JL221]